MVSEGVCDEFLLCVLLWLYVILAWAWPLARVLLGRLLPPSRSAIPAALWCPPALSRPHRQAAVCGL